MIRGFKTNAEKLSVSYRELLGLKAYAPMPAADLANYLGIKLLTPNEIPGMGENLTDILLNEGKDKWSAAIYNKDGSQYIIHNLTHAPCRQESNLMHEIAHAICGHELAELETALSGCVIPLRKYDKNQEEEAEWLGGCLQLPQKALFHYLKIQKKTEKEISEIFNACLPMVNFRIRMTGVRKIRF